MNIEATIKALIEEDLPFNKAIGFKLESIEEDKVSMKFDMSETLIGNYMRKTLHGGVISTALDLIGGVTAFLALLKKMENESLSDDEKLKKLSKLGTIDLRVDYVRPGRGKYFIASAYLLRVGNKFVVTRMDLVNDNEELIALGTGIYNIS